MSETPMREATAIGNVKVSSSEPKIVACIGSMEEAEPADNSYADIIEVKLDDFCVNHQTRDPEEIESIVSEVRERTDKPLLATLRKGKDGGQWFNKFDGDEYHRLEIFKSIMPYIQAVDIELDAEEILDAVIKEGEENGVTKVVSYHDFVETESEEKIIERIRKIHGVDSDIVRVAYRDRGSEENVRKLFVALASYHLSDEFTKPIVAVSMGGIGQVSRVFFPLFGSCLTYGYIPNGKAIAPGQIPVNKLRELMDEAWRKVEEPKPLKIESQEDFEKIAEKFELAHA